MKPGDTVVLKSGGPLMTVVSREGSGDLVLAWFNKQASKFETEHMPESVLEPSDMPRL